MCTNLSMPFNTDIFVLSARTMDFGESFNTVVQCVPRGHKFPLIQPPHGISWNNKYGFLGTAIDFKIVTPHYYSDGLNEQGLSVGMLWLPGTHYAEPAPQNNLYMLDFPGWLLGNFSTVAEVKGALSSIHVVGFASFLETYPPVHFIVQDANGNSITIEFMNQEMQVYDNTNGIMTNAPTYPWQLANMSNYENLTVYNNTAQWWGQEINGSGLLGMPGDAAPPSRFVRATKLCGTIYKPTDTQHAVNTAFQVLQNMVVPYGTIVSGNNHNKMADFTQWGVVRDHKERVYYFFSAFNQGLKAIDLKKLDVTQGDIRSIPIATGSWYTDVTKEL